MSQLNFLISLFFFVLLSSSSCLIYACHKHDEKVMKSIISSFPPNSFPPTSSSWNTSIDCCMWDAIECEYSGRIFALQINDIPTLRGPIPPSIARLSNLTRLVLSNIPGLTGPIPRNLIKLKQLGTFIVSNTSVSGPVPTFLSQLPSLQLIDLSLNRLSGSIPPSLGQLTDLSYLYLNGNKLSGTIPSSLFSRSKSNNRIVLDFSDNKLSGEIPKSFSNVNFDTIRLVNNKLTGDASCLFGKLSQVSSIQLQRNKLSFDITGMEYPLTLQILDVSHNKIYGEISEQITETRLLMLDMSYNRLCGKIPTWSRFIMLDSTAYAHNKCLCGAPLLPPCK